MPGESVVGEGGTHADIMGSVHLKWLSVPLLSLVVLGSGAPPLPIVFRLFQRSIKAYSFDGKGFVADRGT